MKTESGNTETLKAPGKNRFTIASLHRLYLAWVVVLLAGSLVLTKCSPSSAAYDKELSAAASEMNKSCPMMVDKETRLDNAVAMPGKIFQYNYTLINFSKDSVDVKMIQDNLEPTLINGVKTSPDLRSFRDNKVTMDYNYKDKNGVFLLKIQITPEKYATE
jgi:hypothetical protein